MSAKTVSKGILSVAAWNTVKIMASALSAPILARLLGTAGYGQYAYYLAIIAMAWPLANLGTAHIATKYIAERPDDFEWRSHLASFLGIVNLLAALLAGAIITSLLLASPVVGSDQLLLTVAVVGAIILEQGLLFSRGVLYGLHREELITLPAACGAIVAVVLGVILTLAGLGLLGVMVGLLIANLIVAMVTLRYVTQFVKWRFHPNLLRLLPVPGMLRFGLSSILYITLSLTLYRADVILIRHLSSDTEVGLYATAVQWSEFVWFIPMAVQAIMLQSTAPLWAGGRLNELTAMLSRLLRYIALGTAFLLVIVVIFADQILEIYYGPEFREASLALRILAPGVFSFSLARVMWPVIQARGKVLTLVAIMATAVLVNLGLNWFLIPAWGAAGAAIASSVSYGSVIFAYLWIMHREGVQPLKGLAGSRLLLLCLVAGGVAAPIAMFIPSPLVALILGGLVVAGIYGLGIIRLGLIKVSEIQQIIDSLPDPLHKHSLGLFSVLQPMLLRIEVSLPGKL